MSLAPTKQDRAAAQACVKRYREHQSDLERFKNALLELLTTHPDLKDWIHSSKGRLKGDVGVRRKVIRKILDARRQGNERKYTYDGALTELTDLVGVRLLHLYTRQFEEINRRVKRVLLAHNYKITEGPIAKTWDDEYRKYFQDIGVKTEPNRELYTSVHYLVESNSQLRMIAELQIRTLAEELWGEVSHTLDYPKRTKSIACRQQIAVLARSTSSCTRLVDSIFMSKEEFERNRKR